ncbi:tetratricopeptide repeat protein [Pseudoxanthomonas dokdonensis]|uniref:Uncharacterized protein n=1 Tax=Pseudoxanthomonas dokdonensis TaxID=344882 RepID=A0A0R0CV78_9GAMM|nr:tetratricopeptide repeat protein [Pseudoxanthomonas dokdonensis]KRG68856.1 hypothetical protein ABB29_10265 [Pseudoxanthomonas dokdonensis]
MVIGFAVAAVVLVLLALLPVLWPLRRDSRMLWLASTATLAIATFALYHLVGTPAALDPQAQPAQMPATLQQAISELEAELKQNPNQAEGWRLLGRSYAAEQRYADAQGAFERALKLTPDDADVLVETAQARLYNNPQKRFDAQAVGLLQRALQLQPGHQRARWFIGISQRQDGKPAEAAKTWEGLLPLVQPATAATLLPQINEARAEAGLEPLSLPSNSAPQPATGDAGGLLTVTVDIAPQLRAKLSANDTLFVFARQIGGPPMPVAAKRVPANQFPISLTLGDGDSPMPTSKLSQLDQVQLAARVSKAGDVMTRSGDLQAAPVTAEVSQGASYTLLIDQVVP